MRIEVLPHPVSWPRAVAQVLGTVALCAVMILPLILESARDLSRDDAMILLTICGLFFGLPIGVALLLFLRQKGGPMGAGTLSLEPETVRWHPLRGRIVDVPYAALWTASLVGRAGRESLVVRAQRQDLAIAVPKRSLVTPDLAEPLLEEVLDRVQRLPGGQDLRARLEQRRALAQRVASGRKPVVLTLAAILILIFVVEIQVGAFGDRDRMLSLGANSSALVARGEVFRLATGNLLHANLFHIAINLFSLLSLGFFLEPLLGKSRLLTIFLTTALAGAALSAWWGQHDLSVGASTGLLGLYAVYIILAWKWGDQLWIPPMGWKGRLFWVFLVLVYGGKQVDHLGHLGGFAAGCLLMLPALRETDLSRLRLRHRWLYRLAACLLVAVFLVACAMTPLVRSSLGW